MIDSSLSSGTTSALASDPASERDLRRVMAYVLLAMALGTFFLMAVGSATRVMNAGLSCPDWPLCYGQLVPRAEMNLQVFLEWFHRLIASGMGLVTIAVAAIAWGFRHRLPRWFPWAATGFLGLVVVQGILGGLTVTELLRFDIVTAHLGTGLLFFLCLLSSGVLLLSDSPRRYAVGILPWAGLVASALVYSQSLLGGLVASQWALHQCFGFDHLCGVMNSHIFGVIPASLGASVVIGVVIHRSRQLSVALRALGAGVGGLLILQILVGIATFRLRLQVEPLTVAHQAIGAALLGTLVTLTVLAFRQQPILQDVDSMERTTVSPT